MKFLAVGQADVPAGAAPGAHVTTRRRPRSRPRTTSGGVALRWFVPAHGPAAPLDLSQSHERLTQLARSRFGAIAEFFLFSDADELVKTGEGLDATGAVVVP